MLRHLIIDNYALIEHLELTLEDGFSVITGQTGAGKSILLGAIGLLLGARADAHSILAGADKCTVEAEFDGYHIIREVTTAGRSRATINGKSATIAELKALGGKLIDIHSQHQNLLLSEEDFQLQILDILAHSDLEAYMAKYNAMEQAEDALRTAKQAMHASKEEEEFLRYQVQQLEELNPQPGEDEALEDELSRLTHAEDIKSSLVNAENLLDGEEASILSMLREVERQVSSTSKYFSEGSELSERLESSLIELRDITDTITQCEEGMEVDPERLEIVQERLDLLYKLEQKHKVNSSEELISVFKDMQKRLSYIDDADMNLEELEAALKKARKETLEEAEKLTARRRDASVPLHEKMVEMLQQLGMPHVRFEVMISKGELTPTGQDRVSFLFQANKNAPLLPISDIASGGEVARVMLSLKAIISGAVSLPTIIFDEVDTGTSGQMAEAMGNLMLEMGNSGRQVISITHLPQIAAKGTHHYRVWKADTESATRTHITPLSQEERIDELANMLSGSVITDAARENAKALLTVHK